MEEKRLVSLSLICSLAGILLLLIITETAVSPSLLIANITEKEVDQIITFQGRIMSIQETPSITILQVEDTTGSIPVVFFNKEERGLERGKQIIIKGTVKKFEGSLEVEAKEIKE